MKIYVYQNGITLAGKAWEIKAKLREFSTTKESLTLHQFIQRNQPTITTNKHRT